MPCPVDGVGRLQRVWDGETERRKEAVRRRERARERERGGRKGEGGSGRRKRRGERRGLKLAQGFIDSSAWPRNCAARCF